MNILDQKKQELAELKAWEIQLEAEITELEKSWEGEKLQNKDACVNQPLFAKHDCPNCKFEKRCIFVDKGNYSKYRLK